MNAGTAYVLLTLIVGTVASFVIARKEVRAIGRVQFTEVFLCSMVGICAGVVWPLTLFASVIYVLIRFMESRQLHVVDKEDVA